MYIICIYVYMYICVYIYIFIYIYICVQCYNLVIPKWGRETSSPLKVTFTSTCLLCCAKSPSFDVSPSKTSVVEKTIAIWEAATMATQKSHLTRNSSRWFQPIWKMLRKLDHFPRGVKIKHIWNHHPELLSGTFCKHFVFFPQKNLAMPLRCLKGVRWWLVFIDVPGT